MSIIHQHVAIGMSHRFYPYCSRKSWPVLIYNNEFKNNHTLNSYYLHIPLHILCLTFHNQVDDIPVLTSESLGFP